jgi:dolichol-phosphate mannosyltransferase
VVGRSSKRSSFYIVVPVLNEAENLGRLFDAFRDLQLKLAEDHELHVILVDDGSTDGTADLVASLRCELDLTVLSHAKNLGPGRAFATAFEYLHERFEDTDWVATMEGDNTSRHELLATMLQRTNEDYDVIFASPYMYGGGITNTSLFRLVLSHVANAFVKEFLGCHGLVTVSSFFRLYRAAALRKLMEHYGPGIIERAGFEGMVEMAMKMVYLGTRISEVPMVLDTSLREGRSKMKVARVIRGYLCLLLRSRAWRAQAARRTDVCGP